MVYECSRKFGEELVGQKEMKKHRDLTESQNHVLVVERAHVNLKRHKTKKTKKLNRWGKEEGNKTHHIETRVRKRALFSCKKNKRSDRREKKEEGI